MISLLCMFVMAMVRSCTLYGCCDSIEAKVGVVWCGEGIWYGTMMWYGTVVRW